MAIYVGTQKIKPSGIAKVYVGSTLVFETSPTPPSPVPTDYRILEYVQTGSRDCCMNLDFYPTGNTCIECDINFISASWGWARIFGASPNGGKNFGLFIRNNNPVGGQYRVSPNYGSFNPGDNSNTLVSKNTRHVYKEDKGNFYIDGDLKSDCSISQQTFTSTLTLYLGANHTSSGVDSGATNSKIYSFKVWESSTKIRDLVPVQRKSDNVAGMYDIVNNVFYTSITSQQLTAGPVVDPNA